MIAIYQYASDKSTFPIQYPNIAHEMVDLMILTALEMINIAVSTAMAIRATVPESFSAG